MKIWSCVCLGDGMIAGAPAAEIEAVFLRWFAAAGKPPEMAVFTGAESEGRLHCAVIAYFSPAAQTVAQAFEARPCARPGRAGLSLLAGDQEAWLALFPENRG